MCAKIKFFLMLADVHINLLLYDFPVKGIGGGFGPLPLRVV